MKHNHFIKNFVRIVFMIGLSICTSCHPANQQTNVEKPENKSIPDIKRIGMVIKLDSSIFVATLDDGDYYELAIMNIQQNF